MQRMRIYYKERESRAARPGAGTETQDRKGSWEICCLCVFACFVLCVCVFNLCLLSLYPTSFISFFLLSAITS